MATPRKPAALHVIQGTHRKDRHGAKPSPDAKLPEPLGSAPASWKATKRATWDEISSLIPRDVANAADRIVVEVLVNLVLKMRANPSGMTPALAGQIRAACGTLAMTPSDRARLSTPPADVADKYF